jgi:hypothetical protein
MKSCGIDSVSYLQPSEWGITRDAIGSMSSPRISASRVKAARPQLITIGGIGSAFTLN